MRKKDVEKLEKVIGLLEGLHREMSALSKKSPNDAINLFKLKYLNHALNSSNELLGNEYEPLEGFKEFDEDSLPTNSDATFVLSAYIEEVERMRADNVITMHGRWQYNLSDDDEVIRTSPPKKIK